MNEARKPRCSCGYFRRDPYCPACTGEVSPAPSSAERLLALADEAEPRVAEILRRTYREIGYWAPETREERARSYFAEQLKAAGASEQTCAEAVEAVVNTVPKAEKGGS